MEKQYPDPTTTGTSSQDLVEHTMQLVSEVYQRGGSEFSDRAFALIQGAKNLELRTRLELLVGTLSAWLACPQAGEAALCATDAMYNPDRNRRVALRLKLHWNVRRDARKKLKFTPAKRIVARARRVVRRLGGILHRRRTPRTPRHTHSPVQHSPGGGGGPGDGDPDQPEPPVPRHRNDLDLDPPPPSSATTEDTPLRHLVRGLLAHVLRGGVPR